jgi:SAM-dependent methyltransferase
MDLTNRQLYNNSVAACRRSEPILLSDFTARPRVIEVLGDVRGLHVWDLGCGEGLVGRQLASGNPARIDGFDLSEQMIAAARQQAAALSSDQGGPLHYNVADLADPAQLPSGACDGAVAVFLFNYLDLQATEQVLHWVRQALRPGGSFVFTVPHPSLAFLRPAEAPFYIEAANHTYLGTSDQLLEGRIWRRDGISNAIRSRHKTLEDYNRILRRSGWTRMPLIEELGVSEEHVNLDPAFFGPLRGTPLHLLFQVQA